LSPSDGRERVGAIPTTGLDEQLRERGIDTLILAGISTSGGALSSVPGAAAAIAACSCSPTPPPIPRPTRTSS
jgi:nicotinamidase-related amidase